MTTAINTNKISKFANDLDWMHLIDIKNKKNENRPRFCF